MYVHSLDNNWGNIIYTLIYTIVDCITLFWGVDSVGIPQSWMNLIGVLKHTTQVNKIKSY